MILIQDTGDEDGHDDEEDDYADEGDVNSNHPEVKGERGLLVLVPTEVPLIVRAQLLIIILKVKTITIFILLIFILMFLTWMLSQMDNILISAIMIIVSSSISIRVNIISSGITRSTQPLSQVETILATYSMVTSPPSQ